MILDDDPLGKVDCLYGVVDFFHQKPEAKGHYTEGAELIDSVLDVVRKEAEGCDCLYLACIC